MKGLIMWCTYHEDSQFEQYHLREDDMFRLFKGNALDVEGKNINYLNAFYSEIVTLYWVWKNNMRSEKVGFCHYRRKFNQILDMESGACQVLDFHKNFNVFHHYKSNHNYQDYYDAVDIIKEQYGENASYTRYMLEGRTFVPFCCFIMHWEDFDRLCHFLFPILETLDKKNVLNMNPQRYIEKTIKDFRYDNVMYQQRTFSFLAERLISCFLVCEMKIYCLHQT